MPPSSFYKYRAALLAVGLLATAFGWGLRRRVTPSYEARATILLTSQATPILGAADWTTLIKSFRVADSVVKELALYVRPDDPREWPMFRGFTIDTLYLPSRYVLELDGSRMQWVLTAMPTYAVDSGFVADDVGKKFGLKWRVDSSAFTQDDTRRVKFTVSTPREAAKEMIGRVVTTRTGDFMYLTLRDPDPAFGAKVVNSWAQIFITITTRLRLRRFEETRANFESRLAGIHRYLDSVERRLAQPGEDTRRLRHDRDAFAAADTALETEYAQFRLALARAAPDLMLFDEAVQPLEPLNHPGRDRFLATALGGLGLALTLGVIVDVVRRGRRAHREVSEAYAT